MIRNPLRPRRRRLSQAALGVMIVAQLCVALAGTAAAYWSGSGTGPGSAATATTVAVTIAPGSPTATLYPGGQADVVVAASNPNDSAIHIGSLALDPSHGAGGFAVDADHSSCSLSSLSYITGTNGGAGWVVPAEAGGTSGTLSITLSNALSMDLEASNSCQGATFTVYLVAGS